MTEAINLSTDQIIDAAGDLQTSAASSGLLFERPRAILPCPTFAEAVTELNPDGLLTEPFALTSVDMPAAAAGLSKLDFLRVTVGVRSSNQRTGYLPGIIIAGNNGPRIGVLTALPDQRGNSEEDALAPFTGHQQLLLANLWAEQQPQVGGHETGDRVNGGEIGHAVVAASLFDASAIHQAVHDFVDSGQLANSVAETGATDVQRKNGDKRANLPKVLRLHEIAGLVVTPENQLPTQFTGDIFELTAGLTHAASRTQTERPKVDLRANLDGLKVVYA